MDSSLASRSSGAASVISPSEMDVYPETRRGDRIEPVPAQVGKWIPAAACPRMSGSGEGMTNEARAQQPVIPAEAGVQKKARLVKRIIPRNIAFPAVLYSVVTWTGISARSGWLMGWLFGSSGSRAAPFAANTHAGPGDSLHNHQSLDPYCSRSSKRVEGGKGGSWWNGLNPPGIMRPFFYAVIVA